MHQNIKVQLVLNMNPVRGWGGLKADKSSCARQPHERRHTSLPGRANSWRSLTIWQVSSSQPHRWIMTFFNDGASVDVWVEGPQIPATQRRIHSEAHVALECSMTYIWRVLGKSFRFLNNEVPATVWRLFNLNVLLFLTASLTLIKERTHLWSGPPTCVDRSCSLVKINS